MPPKPLHSRSAALSSSNQKIYVWDLPTRLFHWSLVLLFLFQWVSAEIGGDWMDFHMLGGYAILTLVIFRILWGFLGSHSARFSSFLRGMAPTLEFARALRANAAPRYLGHNPLGGWMVMALLAMLGIQATTGLFSSDDVMAQGPLVHRVSEQINHVLTEIHGFGFGMLAALAALHVAAILAHRVFKGEDLVRPMLTGYKDNAEGHAPTRTSPSWLALVLLAAAAGGVAALVR